MAVEKYVLAALGFGVVYAVLPSFGSAGGQTFGQPAAVAIERLRDERRVVNGTGMGSLTIASDGEEGEALLIKIRRAGDREGVRCRVTVTAVSEVQSRAVTDCRQPPGPDEPMRRLGVKALEVVVGEHVAATVQGRAYDVDGVADRMITLLLFNRPTIARSIAAEH